MSSTTCYGRIRTPRGQKLTAKPSLPRESNSGMNGNASLYRQSAQDTGCTCLKLQDTGQAIAIHRSRLRPTAREESPPKKTARRAGYLMLRTAADDSSTGREQTKSGNARRRRALNRAPRAIPAIPQTRRIPSWAFAYTRINTRLRMAVKVNVESCARTAIHGYKPTDLQTGIGVSCRAAET